MLPVSFVENVGSNFIVAQSKLETKSLGIFLEVCYFDLDSFYSSFKHFEKKISDILHKNTQHQKYCRLKTLLVYLVSSL